MPELPTSKINEDNQEYTVKKPILDRLNAAARRDESVKKPDERTSTRFNEDAYEPEHIQKQEKC
jgi:hypothetical protein